MRTSIFIILCLFLFNQIIAQTQKDWVGVNKACNNYIEGFYEGDTLKLINCLKPSLNKLGFWKNNKTGEYENAGYMSYRQAIDYAKDVAKDETFAKADAPKEIDVLEIKNNIAAAKVIAWWGIDFILLSKNGEKWMIEQVLWEGPLEKK